LDFTVKIKMLNEN